MSTPKVLKGGKPTSLSDKIYQANPLIQARKEFDTLGMRIFFLGLRAINPQLTKVPQHSDQRFEPLFIPTAKLTELLGNDAYAHRIKKECDKIFNATIHLTYEDGGFKLMHVFRRLEYVARQGLYLEFDNLMRPYLLDLFKARGYTVLSVEQLFKLTSPYAVRLVELMLQYQNLATKKKSTVIERSMTIAELRFALNVPDDAYQERLNNFKARVLDTPIREINEKTLYKMKCETTKIGRIPTGFKFSLDISALTVKKPLPLYGEPAIQKLKSLGFGEQAARAIRDKCESDGDCLKRITSATKSFSMKSRRAKIENKLGYLRAYIENDWGGTKSKSAATPKALQPVQPRPRISSSPTPIGDILSSIPLPTPKPVSEPAKNDDSSQWRSPAPEDFREGETPLSDALAADIRKAINAPHYSEILPLILATVGLNPERFKELYMRKK